MILAVFIYHLTIDSEKKEFDFNIDIQLCDLFREQDFTVPTPPPLPSQLEMLLLRFKKTFVGSAGIHRQDFKANRSK
jgi:hypothetical protein